LIKSRYQVIFCSTFYCRDKKECFPRVAGINILVSLLMAQPSHEYIQLQSLLLFVLKINSLTFLVVIIHVVDIGLTGGHICLGSGYHYLYLIVDMVRPW
jgi:hypothetical protein